MRFTANRNWKVQGMALQEVYISMEEAFQALKAGLGVDDSCNTFLCVREGKLMRGEDVSHHGSPMYGVHRGLQQPQVGGAVPSL